MRRAVLLVLLLGGCATAPANDFPQKAAAVQQACAQQFQPQAPDAFQRVAACYNAGVGPLRVEAEYPYPDLAELEDSYRMLVAQHRDAGLIDDTQVGVYMAKLRSRIAAEEQARIGQAALIEQQERQARAASLGLALQGMTLMNQANQQNRGMTCTTHGTVTNCW